MSLVNRTDHKPPFWLPNGHLQSIYPALFRVINNLHYERERILTDDQDFLDLDWSFAPVKSESASLVILSHGLEGSSNSQYIRGMVRLLTSQGYDCLSWNYRSCGGEMNKTYRFYHSGATDDLERIVSYAIEKGYKSIHLMGFSLGGNITLKYLGEQGEHSHPEIKRGIVFSVPMDLKASSMEINKPQNSVYMHRFLKTLLFKVRTKSSVFPEKIDIGNYHKVRTLYDFDHLYTAAIHGFDGADDYYDKCSSMHYVESIAVPTLIVNALNDPMVPFTSLPAEKIKPLSLVTLELTSQGGHCGFRPDRLKDGLYWSERRALAFLQGGFSV